MKKLISVLLVAVILVLSFASCSENGSDNSGETDTPKENVSVGLGSDNSAEDEAEKESTSATNTALDLQDADSKKQVPESPADWTLYNLEEMGNMLISISEFNLTAPDPYVCFYGFGDATPTAYVFNNEAHGNVLALELDLSEAESFSFSPIYNDIDAPVCFEIVDEFTYRFYTSSNADDVFNSKLREDYYTHHISRYTVNDKSIVIFELNKDSLQNGDAITLPDSYLLPDYLGEGYYSYFIPSVFIDNERAPEITYLENEPDSLEPDICVKMYLKK